MIAEIAARHGVRLDRDDPAFLMVDLNIMALEDGVESLSKWKDDTAALVGALENGSKRWEDSATAVGNAIFDARKQDFVAAATGEKEKLLADLRAETRAIVASAFEPAVHRLNEATTRAGSKRTAMWAVIGALIGGIVASAVTLYVAKNIFALDGATPGLAIHGQPNKTR